VADSSAINRSYAPSYQAGVASRKQIRKALVEDDGGPSVTGVPSEIRNGVEALLRIADLVKSTGLSNCQIVHGGYPTGFTCLDVQRSAMDSPNGYGPEYGEALRAGKHLCSGCRIRQVLDVLKGNKGG
jgi:hypothetical protein